jgi:hypothetical protein
MSGWNHQNANWKPKECVVCKTEFAPRSGVHKFCSESCRGKWKYITGHASTDNQYLRISGNWTRYVSRLMYYGGRKRDDLNREVILKKLQDQNYKCAITGVDLTCNLERGRRVMTNASIDRIVAGGLYIEENIQIVCHAVNQWRGDLPLAEFINWCRKVVDHSDQSTLRFEQGEKENDHGQKA